MAQETKKVSSPCENYLVAKLESVEKENTALKKENDLLKTIVKDLNNLIQLGTKEFRLEYENMFVGGREIISVYWKDNYLETETLDELKGNASMYDLVMLIKKGQTRVEREQ